MTVSLFFGKEEVQMQKAQYGILRFAKYKGPEISNIEAHNERKICQQSGYRQQSKKSELSPD